LASSGSLPPSAPPSSFGPSSSIDFEIMEFVNDTPREVPLEMRRNNWGFVTRLLGLTMLSEPEAKAQIYRIHEQALFLQSAIPARKINDQFINWIKQFEELCVLKVYQSKLRPRGWINERMIGAYSVQEQITGGSRASGGRKRLLPWGPL
jgi:hypothetical protein